MKNQTRLVLCVILDDLENNWSNTSQMIRRELGIWRRLSHRNIVPFLGIAHGFGMLGTVSLVSLWMPNNSLLAFLAKHDSELEVAHRLTLVRPLDMIHLLIFLPYVYVLIAIGHCEWVTLLCAISISIKGLKR